MPEGTETPSTEGTPKPTDTPTPKPTDEGKAPKWDGEFDPARAAKLVENLRADVAKKDSDLAALKAQVEERGKGEKTLQQRLDALESAHSEAQRTLLVAKVAKEHKVPDDLVEFLTAKDADGLKAQAERLSKAAPASEEVPGKPKPRLKPGQGTDAAGTAEDPKQIAAAYRRR